MRERSGRADMPGRLLRLLSLLQSRREWSGSELAARLDVTDRTLRRDITRLRELDYPVEGATGTAGGYRLVPGAALPPLLLDEEEVTAVATGLVTAAGTGVAGLEDSAIRALAKLERLLPARLRPRLAALARATAVVPPANAPGTDPATLSTLAACCRDREVLSFDYRSRREQASARRVEPHHLVTLQGHWYLLAYDPHRADWRTFRADRIDAPRPARRRFEPRELPAPVPATYLTRSLARARYRYTAQMRVELCAEAVRCGLFAPVPGEIQPGGPASCTVRLSTESAQLMSQYIVAIAALGAEFTLQAPPEITRRLRTLGQRLAE